MSDKDAAMRLAIEALALAQRDAQIGEADYAIRALEAALAEPTRKAATAEEVMAAYAPSWSSLTTPALYFAGWREAERHHGIKEDAANGGPLSGESGGKRPEMADGSREGET